MLTAKQTEHIRATMGALEGLDGARWQFARDHLTAVLASGTREPDPPATVLPTDEQAKRLYLAAGRGCVLESEDQDWPTIADEMRALVAARTSRIAGREIAWWACWDREYTATGFARRVRREWRRMQEVTK